MNKSSQNKTSLSPTKRMLLYARVSTEEQTKGNYPSCESQLDELEAECRRRGWNAERSITDEGYSAGTLKRPGLTQLRWLVESGDYDGLICTWYDRLTRSRDFYILDSEFKKHGVEFITLHDAANTRTAAGRFMESMIVAAKTYDREQTAEKVRTKMRQRLEKGLHQGGLVPFGFLCDSETKLLSPDPNKLALLKQIFQLYVDTRSDFAVRDWLKAHNIPTPHGKGIWQVSSLRDLLCNRRYIGEIEINRKNKDAVGLPEVESYRVVKAHYEPMIPVELFELAQAIRQEKSAESPRRVGRPRSYSQNQCNRVFLLQGSLLCGVCAHAMTPYYVVHKPGKDRKKQGYVYYYICAQQQMQGRHSCGHSNRVLARNSEGWILEQITRLVQEPHILDRTFEVAKRQCEIDLRPQQSALALTQQALHQNQQKIDQIVETISSDGLNADLLYILNKKASQLRLERQQLLKEKRRQNEALMPLDDYFDSLSLRESLQDFSRVMQDAEPQELQQLIRLLVRRIEWGSDGNHTIELYRPKSKKNQVKRGEAAGTDWLESNVRSGGPDRIDVEPILLRVIYAMHNALLLAPTLICRA